MMKRNLYRRLVFSTGLILLFSVTPIWAGDPYSAQYRTDTDRLFWFIQITDIHIGESGSADTDNLAWIVNEATNIIQPEFIVATGDLTDSTNGGTVPTGPHFAEWNTYKSILTDAGMLPDFYYDIPGNHDHYSDPNFDYYLGSSVQGLATGNTQVSWRKDFDFGSYHFLGINTAGNNGAPFSVFAPYGDHAGLDDAELGFIETEFQNHQDADLTLVFGHHPFPQRPTGKDTDTYISYGAAEMLELMKTWGVSLYAYGHTHQYRQGVLPVPDSDGVFDLNADPLGEDPTGSVYAYQLIAVDCNGIAAARQPVGTWPAVLITAPVAVKLGSDPNPYAYSVNDLNPKPVRALVFDSGPVSAVQFRVDDGAWQPMAHVNGPLWTGSWNEPDVLEEEHTLEVRAIGSATRSHVITVGVAESSEPGGTGGGGGGGGGGCFISSLSGSEIPCYPMNKGLNSVTFK